MLDFDLCVVIKDYLSYFLPPAFSLLLHFMTEDQTITVSGAHSPHFVFLLFYSPWHGSHRSLFHPSPQRVSVGIQLDHRKYCKSAGHSSVKFTSRYEVKPAGHGSLHPAGHGSLKPAGRSEVKPTGRGLLQPRSSLQAPDQSPVQAPSP